MTKIGILSASKPLPID